LFWGKAPVLMACKTVVRSSGSEAEWRRSCQIRGTTYLDAVQLNVRWLLTSNEVSAIPPRYHSRHGNGCSVGFASWDGHHVDAEGQLCQWASQEGGEDEQSGESSEPAFRDENRLSTCHFAHPIRVTQPLAYLVSLANLKNNLQAPHGPRAAAS
jgi:hypothetical protein